MGTKGYPAEFRRRVLGLVNGGRKAVDVAADLGISGQTIYNWRRQDRIDCGLEEGRTTEQRGELASAKRRSSCQRFCVGAWCGHGFSPGRVGRGRTVRIG